jgi:hypothetical protein
VIVTGNKYEKDEKENGLIVAKKGDLKLYQTVIAVGPVVREIKVGDKVMINPDGYKVTQYDPNSVKNDMGMNKIIGYKLPWVTVYDEEGNSHEYIRLKDRDIEFVYEGEEVEEDNAKSNLILPKDKSIIMN